MDKKKIEAIISDLEKAIGEVGKKHGFAVRKETGLRATYDDTGFSFRTDLVFTEDPDGKEIDPQRALFEKHCARFGLAPSDYGRDVRVAGERSGAVYTISGIRERARKNPVLIREKKGGEVYCCSADLLLGTDGKPVLPGYHICGYCGAPARGEDEDLLCESCRELFGHTLFSEL